MKALVGTSQGSISTGTSVIRRVILPPTCATANYRIATLQRSEWRTCRPYSRSANAFGRLLLRSCLQRRPIYHFLTLLRISERGYNR